MNAIILAAGLGSRFGEITRHTHKALLPIKGMPNIERTIRYLNEFGVKDIVIVTGYLHHQFSYLKNKYNCTLIHNENYRVYNSIYSMYKAINYFGSKDGTFIIDGDVVLMSNIFSLNSKSCYYLIQRPKSNNTEWVPTLNETGNIVDFTISNQYTPSLLGISYWKKPDTDLIKKEFSFYLTSELLNNSTLYWDDIPRKIIGILKPNYKTIEFNQAVEMDTLEDYQRANDLAEHVY